MLESMRSGSKRTKTIWWALVVITVFTFVIGFNFLGVGFDPVSGRRNEVGKVGDRTIGQLEYQRAIEEAKIQYRQRYGTEPVDRDLRMVEQQAWRNLVNQRLFLAEAGRAGIRVSDQEVLEGVRRIPPPEILASPEFSSNGQFDITRYQQVLLDPNVNWAPYEQRMREEILPMQKLQERLLSSIKLTEPELRAAFSDRYEQRLATIVQVPPADTGSARADDAALQAVYERYRDRMVAGARTDAEVLVVPRRYSEDDIRGARELAQSYFDRWQRGEDFTQLVRDHSEGPNADKGGVIDRWFSPAELGPALGQLVAARAPGDVVPPYQEGGQVFVVRIMDPARDSVAANPPYPGAVKVQQLMVKVRIADESLREQYQEAKRVRDRAAALGEGGLSKAATEKGLSTVQTGFFNAANPPQVLFQAPEAAEWATQAGRGTISPVFVGADEFYVVQVSKQYGAGQPPARKDMTEQLRQIADVEVRVEAVKSRADAIAAAVRSGTALEQAAVAEGLAPFSVTYNRAQPDPRLMASPEVQGALRGARPGQVFGPIRTPAGWYFARLDGVVAAPDSLYNDAVKGQITTDLLTRRQQNFFNGFFDQLRQRSKVTDLRTN